MSLDIAMVTFDCSDPDALAAWWRDAVGGDVDAVAPGEFVMVARANGPTLGFQKVPDPTPGKNKVHLDFHAADKEAEVARLVAAGQGKSGETASGPNSTGWCSPTRKATPSASRADAHLGTIAHAGGGSCVRPRPSQ